MSPCSNRASFSSLPRFSNCGWSQQNWVLTWGAVAALLCMLTPAIAQAAGTETDTGLLSPPMVENKPVNVKTGLRPEYADRIRTISRILYPIVYSAVLVVIALVFFVTAANSQP
jgi:hypothetical protein